jgi:hypothetical protein
MWSATSLYGGLTLIGMAARDWTGWLRFNWYGGTTLYRAEMDGVAWSRLLPPDRSGSATRTR